MLLGNVQWLPTFLDLKSTLGYEKSVAEIQQAVLLPNPALVSSLWQEQALDLSGAPFPFALTMNIHIHFYLRNLTFNPDVSEYSQSSLLM